MLIRTTSKSTQKVAFISHASPHWKEIQDNEISHDKKVIFLLSTIFSVTKKKNVKNWWNDALEFFGIPHPKMKKIILNRTRTFCNQSLNPSESTLSLHDHKTVASQL